MISHRFKWSFANETAAHSLFRAALLVLIPLVLTASPAQSTVLPPAGGGTWEYNCFAQSTYSR